jgi:hypothetical protein
MSASNTLDAVDIATIKSSLPLQAPASKPVIVFVQQESLKKSDGWWPTWGAPISSVFALCLTFGVFLYNYQKDSRARRHSIEDDYWLRKVISPFVIEPLLKTLLEMSANAPPQSGSKGFDKSIIKPFHDKYRTELIGLTLNLSVLSLVDLTLKTSAEQILDNVQDAMIEYCSENELSTSTKILLKSADRTVFQNTVNKHAIELLNLIKKFQISLH